MARAVRERRRELDLSQLDVWQAGGPSNTTLTEIENGRMENLTRTTARKLDAGLQWEAGSARRVWDGGDPTPLLVGVDPKHSVLLHRIAELAQELEEPRRTEILHIIDSA